MPFVPPAEGWLVLGENGSVVAHAGLPQGPEVAAALREASAGTVHAQGWVWQVEPGSPRLVSGRPVQGCLDAYVAARREALVQRVVPAVVHDANNSLGAVLANLRFLGAAVHDPHNAELAGEAQGALEDTSASADQVAALVAALRTLARGDRGRAGGCGPVVREAFELSRYHLRGRVNPLVEGGDGPTEELHRGNLLLAWTELLLAWGKAANEGSTLRTGAAEEGPWLEVTCAVAPPVPDVVRILAGTGLGRIQIASLGQEHRLTLVVS